MGKKSLHLDDELLSRIETESELLGMSASTIVRNRLRDSYRHKPDVTALNDKRASGDVWDRVFESASMRKLFIEMIIGARAERLRLTGKVADTADGEISAFNVVAAQLEDEFLVAGHSGF